MTGVWCNATWKEGEAEGEHMPCTLRKTCPIHSLVSLPIPIPSLPSSPPPTTNSLAGGKNLQDKTGGKSVLSPLDSAHLPPSAHFRVCKHCQVTVHHSFSSALRSAPEIRNLQKAWLLPEADKPHQRAPTTELSQHIFPTYLGIGLDTHHM